MENRFGFEWLTIGFLKPVDSRKEPNQNQFSHQDTGIARTNLPPRARWSAKADAAEWQPSGLEPSWRGFFYVH